MADDGRCAHCDVEIDVERQWYIIVNPDFRVQEHTQETRVNLTILAYECNRLLCWKCGGEAIARFLEWRDGSVDPYLDERMKEEGLREE